MRKFGLIGKTLKHSFSKNYFTEKFESLGISDICSYENFELSSIAEFPSLLQTLNGLSGLNVTIPYKVAIIPFLTDIDKTATEIGAVNTIKFSQNKLTGFNTDVTGFINAIKPFLKPYHKGALILGTGGASKAVEWSLNKLGIEFMVISRNPGKDYAGYTSVDKEVLRIFPVIINTTPLGTFPEINSAPELPYHLLNGKNLLFDLVYNPPETHFMQLGKKQGATVTNGLEMLKIQAEEAWKIWNAP